MRFIIQVFFNNNTQHNFFVEADEMAQVEDLLLEYQENRDSFIFSGSKEQPCIFNSDHVLLVVASEVKEIQEEVPVICDAETCCSKESLCH